MSDFTGQRENEEPRAVIEGYDVWQGVSGCWHARQLGPDSRRVWDASGEDLGDLRDMVRRFEARQSA